LGSSNAKSNRLKHGISFEEAATAFLDPAGLDGEYVGHSESEEAFAFAKK
jgi:uncharacterized DUF497 family protein